MTATALKLRPRDVIKVFAIGGAHVADQMMQLAKLRLDHPGGVPIMEPQAWSAAYAGGKIVAAIGYFMVQENHVIVTEVDRTPDHWGRVGTMVLFQQFMKAAERDGIRVQTLVMPKNTVLKDGLTKLGLHLSIEVWEV